MFSRGPVPALVHGILDYVLAGVLIAAPFVLSFDETAATVLAIIAGLGALLLAACTAWTTGIIKSIPVRVHAVLDYVVSIFLIVSPFLLGFNDDDTASAFFVVLGIAVLLLTVATRFTPGAESRRRSPSAA